MSEPLIIRSRGGTYCSEVRLPGSLTLRFPHGVPTEMNTVSVHISPGEVAVYLPSTDIWEFSIDIHSLQVLASATWETPLFGAGLFNGQTATFVPAAGKTFNLPFRDNFSFMLGTKGLISDVATIRGRVYTLKASPESTSTGK